MGFLGGRVAIVTGARGVGRADAIKLAEPDAKLIVNDLGGDNAGILRDACWAT